MEKVRGEELMRYMLLLLALMLVGCQGTTGRAIESLGVTEGENAMACLKGGGATNATVVNGQISGVAIELPPTLDLTAWNPDEVQALIDAICGRL